MSEIEQVEAIEAVASIVMRAHAKADGAVEEADMVSYNDLFH